MSGQEQFFFAPSRDLHFLCNVITFISTKLPSLPLCPKMIIQTNILLDACNGLFLIPEVLTCLQYIIT